MTKHKRKFKGWVIVRPDGEVVVDELHFPLVWVNKKMIKYPIESIFESGTIPKRVTIVVEL